MLCAKTFHYMYYTKEQIMNISDEIREQHIAETIKGRRSMGRMTEERPTHEQVTRILESATYAPNHHRIEPWKFFVVGGKAREELGQVMADALIARLEETLSEKAHAKIQKERQKPLQAPLLIAVAVERTQESWVREIENIEAVAAAVQNMLLTAEALGLASLWRTGDAAYDPRVKAWFGLGPNDHIVAFVYLGFAAGPRPERTPTSYTAKTRWLGWDKPQ